MDQMTGSGGLDEGKLLASASNCPDTAEYCGIMSPQSPPSQDQVTALLSATLLTLAPCSRRLETRFTLGLHPTGSTWPPAPRVRRRCPAPPCAHPIQPCHMHQRLHARTPPPPPPPPWTEQLLQPFVAAAPAPGRPGIRQRPSCRSCPLLELLGVMQEQKNTCGRCPQLRFLYSSGGLGRTTPACWSAVRPRRFSCAGRRASRPGCSAHE